MFFDGIDPVWRTIVLGVISYALLVTVLRIMGKRTLAKMNAFDFVVTFALGSTLAAILLSEDVALVEGMTALVLLTSLQFVLTFFSQRSTLIRDLVKSEPSVVFFRGAFEEEAMRRTRLVEGEVLQAMRERGFGSTEDVYAVVLETSGELSVIRAPRDESHSTIRSLV